MKVNLGCGLRPLAGYINVDSQQHRGVDVVANLNEPWPFEDHSVDFINACHIFEHIAGPQTEACGITLPGSTWCFNEAWRILKPGGILACEVPTTDGWGAFQDPTHVVFYTPATFKYMDPKYPAHYGLYFPTLTRCAFDCRVHPEMRDDNVAIVKAHCKALPLPE